MHTRLWTWGKTKRLYKPSSTYLSKINVPVKISLTQKEEVEKFIVTLLSRHNCFTEMRFLSKEGIWSKCFSDKEYFLVCNIVEPVWVVGLNQPLPNITWSDLCKVKNSPSSH